MVDTTDSFLARAKADYGLSLTGDRIEEIAAQMNALGASVRAHAGRSTFEDEPAGFVSVLSLGKAAEDGE